jgi:ATP-binding cassette subfamily B protein
LVGENGSGKSTLAKLLTGLCLPDLGTVSWDGTDIRDVDPRQLHGRVAVVMQNPTEWPTTAANNIRIGRIDRPDPGDERLAGAAARSGADAVVGSLPDGYDTVLIVEQGTHKQLIAATGSYAELFGLQAAAYGDAGP